jgi:uncharacterized protein (TIGR04255 family)
MATLAAPFSGPAPKDIPLPRAPLLRVLTQIRFPIIVSIDKQDFIAPFQEAIRGEFPNFQSEQGKSILIGPEGVKLQDQVIWRFASLDNSSVVSLSQGFIALEVTEYRGKEHFLKLLLPILKAAQDAFHPSRSERIGLRYINRLHGDDLAGLESYFRPEVHGVLSTEIGLNLKHSITETLIDTGIEGLSILARWGLLGMNLTHDPVAVPPIGEKSWILDIDAFAEPGKSFNSAELISRMDSLADADYRFFRWATTDDCLRYFGGAI